MFLSIVGSVAIVWFVVNHVRRKRRFDRWWNETNSWLLSVENSKPQA